MATCTTEYFKGQGVVYIKPYNTNEGWVELGDCERLAVETSQQFTDIYESCSGSRNIVAHVINQTDWNFTADAKSFSKDNLARALYGTSSVIAADTAVEQELVFTGAGQVQFLENLDVENVVITQGATTLTADTDYSVDGATGMVTLLSTANLTGPAPYTLDVQYDHGAFEKIDAATRTMVDFSFRLVGINQVTGKRVIVDVPRVALNLAAAMEFLNATDTATFSMGGMVLPDSTAGAGDSQYVQIRKLP